MKRLCNIAVSFGPENEPEHWLVIVRLPKVHLEPACGACRADSIFSAWDCGRRKASKVRLLCKECQKLLDSLNAAHDAEIGLFDDTQAC